MQWHTCVLTRDPVACSVYAPERFTARMTSTEIDRRGGLPLSQTASASPPVCASRPQRTTERICSVEAFLWLQPQRQAQPGQCGVPISAGRQLHEGSAGLHARGLGVCLAFSGAHEGESSGRPVACHGRLVGRACLKHCFVRDKPMPVEHQAGRRRSRTRAGGQGQGGRARGQRSSRPCGSEAGPWA